MTKALPLKITQRHLKQLVHYNPTTGQLIDKRTSEIVGHVARRGHLQTKLNGLMYTVAHLVWKYHTGEWPSQNLKHIDGDVTNNRIENLRYKLPKPINPKTAPSKSSTTGFRGVSLHKPTNTFRGYFTVKGKLYSCGYHQTPEAANDAVIEAKRILKMSSQ